MLLSVFLFGEVTVSSSAIIDNRSRGKVGDFLKEHIKDSSRLSFVSAYFTIYAYERLKEQLDSIDHLDFLFGEPRFVKSIDPDKTDKKAFSIVNDRLTLSNQLQQKSLAKSCHEWITRKVQIKTIKQASLLHGKMYCIDDDGRKKALVGSSNFTVSGMGYGANPNIELNLEVDSDRGRAELKQWFDEIWNNEELVKDVKEDVLTYLSQLYADHPPQFIYFKTLFHLFYHKILEQDQGGLFDETSHIKDTKIWKLLFDFQRKGVGELWKELLNAKPVTHYTTSLAKVNAACVAFNTGFNQALTALHPKLNTISAELLGSDVVVSPFRFAGITYQSAHFMRDRKFNGQELKIDNTFRGHQPDRPQNFLNEARLSALGLAIYLAGRLAFIPATPAPTLKLLVLDDVLIGLDHSNRLPVLEVLKKHFTDWQIVLLTHDRVWFEMARMYTQDSNLWSYAEVYESEDVDRGIPYPIVRKVNDKAAYGCLEQARKFLADHHVPASANYARASFELALKLFCQRFAVPVQFNMDPRHVDTENLLSAVERWIKDHAAKATMAGVIEGVKLFRKVVLNPYSHASPPNIAEAEVKGAIYAIERLLDTLDPKKATDKKPLEITRSLLAAPTPTVEDVVTAMSYLRAAFTLSLRSYCERKRVAVAYSNALSSNRQLWDKAKTDVTHPIPHTIVPAVEAHGHILIDEPSLVTVTGLTQITLQAALAAIEVTGCPEKTVLD